MPTNEPLSWSAIFLIIGVGLMVLAFSLAGSEEVESTTFGFPVLLNRTNQEVTITGNGNCYNYSLPQNSYSAIIFDVRGVFTSSPTSSANLTLFINGLNVASVGSTNDLAVGTFNVPLSIEYGQNQQASVLVEVNSTNSTGSPILNCKSFYVWGIV